MQFKRSSKEAFKVPPTKITFSRKCYKSTTLVVERYIHQSYTLKIYASSIASYI